MKDAQLIRDWCGRDFTAEGIAVPPWWMQCCEWTHETSWAEHDHGRIEFWCSDCHKGAGRGEIVRPQAQS